MIIYFNNGIDPEILSSTYWNNFVSLLNDFPKATEKTKAEYDAQQLAVIILPNISKDNTYQSAHKNGENNTLNLLATQMTEIQTTLLLQIMDKRVPADYTATIVKLRNLEAYSKELAKIAIERQAYIKEEMEKGVDVKVAEAAALKNIKITDVTSLVGKHLHEAYVNVTLGIPVVDKFKQDTVDVNYSTHLSEDEPYNEKA